MTNWTNVYEWLNTHPAFGRETPSTRQKIQVAVYFKRSGSSGQYTADILGVSRQRVAQFLKRARELYEDKHQNINWTVYHWLLENYPTERKRGTRCRALETLHLKVVEGLTYDEIAKRLGGDAGMHSERCARARKTHRRAMAFFVELMDRLALIIEQERT